MLLRNSIARRILLRHESKIGENKALSFLVLTEYAWFPILLSIIVASLFSLYSLEFFDSSGALLLCGALIAELAYFSVKPEWRKKASRFADEFVGKIPKKENGRVSYQSQMYVKNINIKDGRVTNLSKSGKAVSYKEQDEINEFIFLMCVDRTKYATNSNLEFWLPGSAKDYIDLYVALIIGFTALLGTIIWGFGEHIIGSGLDATRCWA